MVRAMLTAAAMQAQHLPTTAAVAVSKQTVTVLPLLPWRDPAVSELLQEELLHRFVARHSCTRWPAGNAAALLLPLAVKQTPAVLLLRTAMSIAMA
jgi:hypothetical protein